MRQEETKQEQIKQEQIKQTRRGARQPEGTALMLQTAIWLGVLLIFIGGTLRKPCRSLMFPKPTLEIISA